MFIEAKLRPLMTRFYAFARQADDLADDPRLDAPTKLARLDRFERGLDGAPDGEPVAARLREALAARGRPDAAGPARALLAAFRQDAAKSRYRSWAELRGYCRLSADPVGRFVLAIHDEPPQTQGPADALCAALQVLNHLQDLRADYRRLGRVYLPLDWIEAEGGRAEDLDRASTTPALRRAIDRALGETAALLGRAAPLPDRLRSRRLAGEVRTILALARRLQRRLEDGDPLARRIAPTRADFAWSAVLGIAAWLRPAGRARSPGMARGPA